MPPPSLSTTTIVRSMSRDAAPSRPLVSCRSATSPMSTAVGAPRRRGRRPTAVDTHAVDAVGAPVGVHVHACAGRGEPLDVAHGHRRRDHERSRRRAAPPSRRARHPARCRPSSVEQGLVDGALARLPPACAHAREPRRRPTPRVPTSRFASCRHDRRRIGARRQLGRCDRDRSTRRGGRPRPATRLTRRQPLRQHLRRRLLAEPQHDLRAVVAPRTADAAAARRTRRPWSAPARERPSGGRRAPASRAVRPARALAATARAAGPRRRRPARRRAPRPALSTAASSSSVRSVDHRVPRTAVGRPAGSGPGVADERIAERQVEVHRPRPRPPRRAPRPRPARRATATCRVPRRPAPRRRRTTAPSRRRGAVWSIVCGRRDALQLGRTVGGAREQRHARLVGLDDRGVQLDGRGAAGRQHDRRAPARQARARAR